MKESHTNTYIWTQDSFAKSELPEISIDHSSRALFIGTSLEIDCDVTNSDYSVSWYHNGTKIPDQNGRRLKITTGYAKDSGFYQCSANNKEQGLISNRASIQFIGKSSFWISYKL